MILKNKKKIQEKLHFFYSVINYDIILTEFLLNKGASRTYKDKRSKLPVDYAETEEMTKILQQSYLDL